MTLTPDFAVGLVTRRRNHRNYTIECIIKSDSKEKEMLYDVAIAGAGPAGLMAAKTAAEKGLKAVLIERRNDISIITRACCQQFIMDENFQGETIKLEPGKIIFAKNGFIVDYSGPTFDVTDKYYISPSGHKIHFAYADKRPIVVKFDKGLLLQGLWEQCERLGVEMRNGTSLAHVIDSSKGIELRLIKNGRHSTLNAKKIVLADGVNARSAGKLGLNKDRTFFASALCTLSVIEGIENYECTAIKSHMGLAYQSFAPVIMGPALEGRNIAYLVTIGNKERKPEQIFQNVTTKSPLASMFANARVIKKTACLATAYSSLKIPYKGNALVIGDAAAYVEVETQGALTCGFHAGNAVLKELSGENGFEEYTGWWQNAFEFNSEDSLQVAQGYALVPTYTDDELDYLFALIEDETLEGSFSQYKSPRLMWDAILKHDKRINTENPELYQKIRNKKLTLSDVL
jgi:digeranylgeranylglycerophospholipid reductase